MYFAFLSPFVCKKKIRTFNKEHFYSIAIRVLEHFFVYLDKKLNLNKAKLMGVNIEVLRTKIISKLMHNK